MIITQNIYVIKKRILYIYAVSTHARAHTKQLLLCLHNESTNGVRLFVVPTDHIFLSIDKLRNTSVAVGGMITFKIIYIKLSTYY